MVPTLIPSIFFICAKVCPPAEVCHLYFAEVCPSCQSLSPLITVILQKFVLSPPSKSQPFLLRLVPKFVPFCKSLNPLLVNKFAEVSPPCQVCPNCLKMELASKVVKNNSKIIISLPRSKSLKLTVSTQISPGGNQTKTLKTV
jgi:hypothetical protein